MALERPFFATLGLIIASKINRTKFKPVFRRASLKSFNYCQPEPEPGSDTEEYYQVVPFQAKVVTLPGHFWEAFKCPELCSVPKM